MTNLEIAREYLKNGFSIFPVGYGEDKKSPYLNSWRGLQKNHPTDKHLQQWWGKYFAHAGIAIVTGKISNLIVVDVDKDKITGKIGKTSDLPKTRMAMTGSGGIHYYYRYTTPMGNRIRARELTDIKGDGGYVIAPPSEHKSGNKYFWINPTEDFTPFPIELFGKDIVKEARKDLTEADLKDWEPSFKNPLQQSKAIGQVANGVVEGGRNVMMTEAVGSLFRRFPRKEWESKVWPLMMSLNNNNKPPLKLQELRTIFESISKRAVNDPLINDTDDKLEKVSWYSFTEVLSMASDEIAATNSDEIISFGYRWLDDKLTGFFESELVVLGAESGIGKTTFATNMLYKLSDKGVKCAVFALEDRLNDYGIKALYFELGRVRKSHLGLEANNYDWNTYRKNAIEDPDYKEYIKEAKKNLERDNLFFAKVDTLMDIDMLEKLIEDKVAEGFKVFLIDHLHYFDLLKGDSSKSDYVERVMVRLKSLQNKTGARVLLIVHFKKLEGKKPTLDSFKDSISIVQNANYVITLWRDRSPGGKKDITYLMVPKSRNPNGEFTLKLRFDSSINDYILEDSVFGTATEKRQEYDYLMNKEKKDNSGFTFDI